MASEKKLIRQRNLEIGNDDSIDLVDLIFYQISKIKVLIAVFIAGAVVSGLITHFLITPEYRATSKVYMVSSSTGSALDLTDLRIGDSLSSDYMVLMKTRPIYTDVKKELGFDYSFGKFSKMVSLDTIDDSRVVSITVTSTDPEEAKNIANCVAEKAVYYIPKIMETPAPHIAEYAITPRVQSAPSLTKNTIFCAFAAWFVAVIIYTIKFLVDDTLKTSEDVEKEFGIMPFAVIPEGNISGLNTAKSNKKKSKRKR